MDDQSGCPRVFRVRRTSLCKKPRGWPMQLTEWAKKLRSVSRVASSRQADHSSKPIGAFRQLTDFSKSRWEAVFQAWEQLLRVRHLGDMVEVQTRYAQGAYDAYMSEMSKLG